MQFNKTSYALLAFEPQNSQLILCEFDAKVDTGANALRIMTGTKSKSEFTEYIRINGNDAVQNGPYGSYSNNETYNDASWLHVKLEVDQENRTYNALVTSKDGNTVYVNKTDQPVPSGKTITDMNCLYLLGYGAYIDNISVSNIEASEIKYGSSASNLTFDTSMISFATDDQTIAYADGAAALDPDTKKIEIDFGVDIDSGSVNNKTVALYNAAGTKLDATASVSGSKVTLTPNNKLNPNTGYILYLSPLVSKTGGGNLGNAQQITFNTGKGKLKAKLNYVGTDASTTSFGAGESMKANLTVSNGTSENQTISVYIAYFDSNNVLCKIDKLDQTVEAGTDVTEIDVLFTAATDAAAAKLTAFVWNDDMKPLDATKSLTKN